jgi:hypothetical protein
VTEAKQQRGLSPADFSLVRAVVTWRRQHAHSSMYPRAEFSTNRGWGHFLSWTEAYPAPLRARRKVAVEVAHYGSDDPEDCPRQLRLTLDRPGDTGREGTEIEPRTVTEAVDLLVAVGFLPARFSSAYRAGWDARHEAATVACRDGIGSPGLDSPEVRALEPAVRA